MLGVLPETTGGMRFEASIGGKKENCDFAIGQSRCQPNCSHAIRIVFERHPSFSLRNADPPQRISEKVELPGQSVQRELIGISPDPGRGSESEVKNLAGDLRGLARLLLLSLP
jgi:hypothetical protein